MAPVAAVVAGVGSAIGGAVSAIVATATAAAPVASVVVGTMAVAESQKARKEGASQAEKARSQRVEEMQIVEEMQEKEMQFAEKQAGEYYGLTREQMELQSQSAQIKTLSNLIAQRRRPAQVQQQVITLPAARTYSPFEQINRAIDEFIKKAG